MSVDLPAPLSPMTARTSPGYRSRSTPSSPTTRPNVLTRPARRTSTGVRGAPASDRRWRDVVAVMPHLPDPLVDGDGEDHQHADGEHPVLVVDAGQGQAAAEEADDERAEQRAEHGAPAAEQAGAADDDGGDALQVGVGDRVRAGRAGPADEDPGGQAVDRAGHRRRR